MRGAGGSAGVAIALALAGAAGLAAQGSDDGPAPSQLGPFRVTAGLQDGVFALSLDADTALYLRGDYGARYVMFAGLVADGDWSAETDQTPSFSFHARPGVAFQRVSTVDGAPRTAGPWLHLFSDVRYRVAPVTPAGDEADPAPLFLSQLIAGGGAEARWADFPLWWAARWNLAALPEPPRVALTYYDILDNSLPDAALPEALRLDVWQARAEAAFPLPVLCEPIEVPPAADPGDVFADADTGPPPVTCPLMVLGKAMSTVGDGIDPEWYGEIGVLLFFNETFAPVIRYRSGAEHGLHYDEQLLLGLLVNL